MHDIQLYKIGNFQRLRRGFLADPSKLDPQINYLVWSLLLQKVFAPAVSGAEVMHLQGTTAINAACLRTLGTFPRLCSLEEQRNSPL